MILNILLWAFLILLLLLSLFLFMPVTYRIEGKVNHQAEVLANASWLWLFQVFYTYTPVETDFIVKIGFHKTSVNPLLLTQSIKRNNPKDKPHQPFKFSNLRGVLTNIDIKPIIKSGILLVKRLYKNIAPSHLKLHGTIGFNDPCTTGRFMGLYEAVAGVAGQHCDIVLKGDFSQKIFKFDLKAVGYFSVASLALPCIRFVIQKPVRKVIFNTKRIKGRD